MHSYFSQLPPGFGKLVAKPQQKVPCVNTPVKSLPTSFGCMSTRRHVPTIEPTIGSNLSVSFGCMAPRVSQPPTERMLSKTRRNVRRRELYQEHKCIGKVKNAMINGSDDVDELLSQALKTRAGFRVRFT